MPNNNGQEREKRSYAQLAALITIAAIRSDPSCVKVFAPVYLS